MPRGKQKSKDEFIDWSVHAAYFVRDNYKALLWAIGITALIFVAIVAFDRVQSYRTNRAAIAFFNAQKVANNPEAQFNAFKGVVDRYGSTAAGREAMMMVGKDLFQRGDFSAALTQFETLSEKSSGEPLMQIAALHMVAATQKAMGKIEDAAKTYVAASENPKNLSRTESMYRAALCYEELKRYDDAAKLYRKAIETAPENEMRTLSEERLLWLLANGSIAG